MLYNSGVDLKTCFDELNLTEPNRILDLHKEYIEAGAQIIETNTYTVFAKIEVDGTLIYITDTAYPVITRGAPTDDVEVLVVPVG